MLLREKSSFLEKLAHAVEAMATMMETRIKYLMLTNVEVGNEAVVEVEVEVEGFLFKNKLKMKKVNHERKVARHETANNAS
jgi:hypothetical protein